MTERPQAWEIRLKRLSFNSGLVPPPHWITPVPTSRSTSVSAKSSDSGAQAAGIRVPAMSKWFMLRVIEIPRAPASSASRTMRRIVSSSASLADGAHVLGERLPRPGHARFQHVHGNRFDVGEHPGQLLALGGLHGSERQRAVPDDDAGGAVVTREGAERIPEDLRVVVAVVVHEPRRDDPAIRLNDPPRGSAEAPELHDLALRHPDVAVKGGPARAIDDASVL